MGFWEAVVADFDARLMLQDQFVSYGYFLSRGICGVKNYVSVRIRHTPPFIMGSDGGTRAWNSPEKCAGCSDIVNYFSVLSSVFCVKIQLKIKM